MKRMFAAFGGLILMCYGVVSPAYAENSVLFACNEFPPYKMEKSESGLRGFDVEFLEEAFNRAGIPLNIVYMPWKRSLAQAQIGKVNGICSCSRTEVGKQICDYRVRYFYWRCMLQYIHQHKCLPEFKNPRNCSNA